MINNSDYICFLNDCKSKKLSRKDIIDEAYFLYGYEGVKWIKQQLNEDIYALRRQGISLKKIAKIVELSPSRANTIGKSQVDIQSIKTRRNEEICRLRNEGLTHKELAKQFDLSVQMINYVLRQSGKEFSFREKRNTEIRRLKTEGVTIKELSIQFNLSNRTIRAICTD